MTDLKYKKCDEDRGHGKIVYQNSTKEKINKNKNKKIVCEQCSLTLISINTTV